MKGFLLIHENSTCTDQSLKVTVAKQKTASLQGETAMLFLSSLLFVEPHH